MAHSPLRFFATPRAARARGPCRARRTVTETAACYRAFPCSRRATAKARGYAVARASLRTAPTDAPLSANLEVPMFIALAILLFVAWMLGFTVLHVSSAAIHLLILFAIVSAVAHLFRGRRAT